MSIQKLFQAHEEVLHGNVYASVALDRLHYAAGDLAAVFCQDILHALQRGLAGSLLPALSGHESLREMHIRVREGIGAPHGNPGYAHGESRAAVEPSLEGDESLLLGVEARENQGSVIGLGAAAAEEHLLYVTGQHPGQLFSQLHHGRREIYARCVLEALQLLLHAGVDLGIAVPAVHHGDAREEVQVAAPGVIEKVFALAAHDMGRIFVEMHRVGIKEIPLLLYDSL